MRRVISITLGLASFVGGVYLLYLLRTHRISGLWSIFPLILICVGGAFVVVEVLERLALGLMKDDETWLSRILLSWLALPKRLAFSALFLFLFAPIVAAMSVVGYQSFRYLRDGIWRSFSTIDGIEYLFGSSWTKYPTDWIGLHALLSSTPLSAALIVIGVTGLFLYIMFLDALE